MDSLSGSTRSKVRRGLKRFDVAVASRASIVEEGYSVYLEACSRYETHEAVYSQDEFVEAVDSLPDCTEFWAVREVSGGELVAFSENYVEDQTCFYNTIWFRPASLKQYSSYALFFGMNRHYLEERGFRYVSDGARSLSHDTSIHEFLESKFGFRKAYAKLHVVYRPWLGVLVALAFPFRTVIERVPLGPFRKASILLRQEAVRRSCQKDTR